ncbi:MAG: hypothetical protein V4736_05380 [Bdellovibrionota bacterium]
MNLEDWELASYVVTVVGFPFALLVFMWEQRRERQNEDEEIYQQLSDEYAKFSAVLLENADLRLMSEEVPDEQLNPEQRERKKIIFDMLVSLFERAFILVYEEGMDARTYRLWKTWEDYIQFWCRRKDFRKALPELLEGEDPDFMKYIMMVVASVERGGLAKAGGVPSNL